MKLLTATGPIFQMILLQIKKQSEDAMTPSQKYMIELPTEEEIQEFISCQNY